MNKNCFILALSFTIIGTLVGCSKNNEPLAEVDSNDLTKMIEILKEKKLVCNSNIDQEKTDELIKSIKQLNNKLNNTIEKDIKESLINPTFNSYTSRGCKIPFNIKE